MAASRLMPALVLLLAVPATAAENATFWANVDSDFNYWMDADAPGEPAYGSPGYLCSAAGGTAPVPCNAAADPVVWELPLRLTGVLQLDTTRPASMAAWFSASPCEFVVGLGCGPDGPLVLQATAELVQGNTTLVPAGTVNVTLTGTPAEATWSGIPNATVLDPAGGNITWRITVKPTAGAANGLFLGMSNGTWSGLVLPLAEPAPEPAPAPATVTATTTRTATQSLTSTITVTHTWTRMVAETVAADDAAAQGLPAGGLVLTAALLVAAAAFRARLR